MYSTYPQLANHTSRLVHKIPARSVGEIGDEGVVVKTPRQLRDLANFARRTPPLHVDEAWEVCLQQKAQDPVHVAIVTAGSHNHPIPV